MNPVNATALYISASRLVLNYDPGDPKAFTEINRLLPYFRQSLSCCVCGEAPTPPARARLFPFASPGPGLGSGRVLSERASQPASRLTGRGGAVESQAFVPRALGAAVPLRDPRRCGEAGAAFATVSNGRRLPPHCGNACGAFSLSLYFSIPP